MIVARHSLGVRVCHWINAVCVGYLAVSGMAILLDYPELYWGKDGYIGEPTFLKMADLGITMEGNRNWGRNTHFVVAWIFALNGLVYLLANIAKRTARDYDVLQRTAYLAVILFVCPMIVVTGLAQAPGLTAAVPQLIDVFGGRQTARTLHFIFGALLMLFALVHVSKVLGPGVVNRLRSMITGRFELPERT